MLKIHLPGLAAVSVSLVIHSTALAAGDTRPSNQLSLSPSRLTAAMYDVFGVKVQQASSRDALIRVVKAFDGPAEAWDKAVDQLASEVSDGRAPRDTLSTKYDLYDVHVADDFRADPKRWPYGPYIVVPRLYETLLSQARGDKQRDPARAARYGRTVVILETEEDMLFGPPDGQSILDDPEFRGLLRLTDSQAKSLDELMASARRDASGDWAGLSKLGKAVLGAWQGNGPPPKGAVADIVAMAKDAVGSAHSPFIQLRACAELFELRRILMRAKDADGQKVLKSLVERWEAAEKDQRIKKWLDQSVNMETTPEITPEQAEKIFPKIKKPLDEKGR